MSAGDIQEAIVNVTAATAVNNASPTFITPISVVPYTFYKVASRDKFPTFENILHFTSPGMIALGTIGPNTWLQANSFFYWDQGNNQIKWGTVSNDAKPLPTALVDMSTTIPGAQPPSSPAPASNATPSAISTPAKSIPAVVPSLPTMTTGPSSTLSLSTNLVPQASTTSSVPKPTGNKNNGITAGAAAGIAIGCLVAGALISGLALWFCWGKRRNAKLKDQEASRIALMPREKGFNAQAVSLEGGSPVVPVLAGGLPQPTEDQAISGEVSKISSSIKNHVQSYYHADRVNGALIVHDDFQALGSDRPVSDGTLHTLLSNSATREIALRFCIAWVVCSRMQVGKDARSCLLPSEMAELSRRLAYTHRGTNADTSTLAQWRVSTAELMKPAYVRDAFGPQDSRNTSIQAAISTLDDVLRPYADSRMDNAQRTRNLEEILKRSATFALTLFSQPSTWSFDWKEEQGVKSGELCIFPALVQLTDETGEALRPPRPFSDAVVRRLDG